MIKRKILHDIMILLLFILMIINYVFFMRLDVSDTWLWVKYVLINSISMGFGMVIRYLGED